MEGCDSIASSSGNNMSASPSSSSGCSFIKKKRKAGVRTRECVEMDEADPEAGVEGSVAKDIREIQKLRRRPAGLSAEELASGGDKPSKPKKEAIDKDPLKLQTGGIVDLAKLKRSEWADVDVEENIKQNFSKESHLRDEDEEMRKYVEEELARRTGRKAVDLEDGPAGKPSQPQPQDDLFELPDRLKQVQSNKTEEMLSNQMLCGIPEVDLGIDVKIKNIEDTEAAKLRLLKKVAEDRQKLNQATTAIQDIAKESAKQYVQHSRYKIDNYTEISTEDANKLDRPRTEKVAVVDEDTPKWVLMETTPHGTHKRAIGVLAGKPSDKETREKFMKKEAQWTEDQRIKMKKAKEMKKST